MLLLLYNTAVCSYNVFTTFSRSYLHDAVHKKSNQHIPAASPRLVCCLPQTHLSRSCQRSQQPFITQRLCCQLVPMKLCLISSDLQDSWRLRRLLTLQPSG